MTQLKIAFVTGECVPFAKSGGLGDVSSALPKALSQMGHHTIVFMPRYRCVNINEYQLRYFGDFSLDYMGHKETIIVRKGKIKDGPDVLFIDNYHFFDRQEMYGYQDDMQRFIFFSQAVIHTMRLAGFNPDIIHCNDWHTGLIPAFVKINCQKDPFLKNAKLIYTIHNLAYQGSGPSDLMNLTGIDWKHFNDFGLEYYGALNLMKAGISYSDAITTVSETYAQEIQTSEYGYGLEGLLQQRNIDLFGIVNGADYNDWNPATDPHTYGINYDLANFHKKEEIKNCLCDELRLFKGAEPIIGIVSRLVSQKGFETLSHVFHKIMELPVKFAILGTGQPEIENFFLEMTARYPGRVSANITFNNAMSHKIEAGADMFLMPSVYEPCGLNQIYSLRYGTIPIVRATGGLADTVIDYNSDNEHGNGFSYYDPHGDYLANAVKRAVETYFTPLKWMKIVENAMNSDFSWNKSAKKYEQIYFNRLGIF